MRLLALRPLAVERPLLELEGAVGEEHLARLLSRGQVPLLMTLEQIEDARSVPSVRT